ncbi:MAG: hypothetical protein IJU98_05735, partial [Synergistaceae bacterium]|nr:hypothetical protein [Synergistaceae bacterium]
MRNFWWAVGILTVAAALSISPAEADYLLDDLYKPSGTGEQWMVVTGNGATLGDQAGGKVGEAGSKSQPLEASGDIVSVWERNSVAVMNGKSEQQQISNTADGRGIYAMYFVHKEKTGTLTVDFHAPLNIDEATTPDVLVGEMPTGYQVEKSGDKRTVKETAKRYELTFTKNTNGYGSTHGQFLFHQNPEATASQTGIVPFVIANVRDSTAEKEPLLIRATLKDKDTKDIVVYDAFDWDVVNNKDAGGKQWVLGLVKTYPTDEKLDKYSLITEVTNHTSCRYGNYREDSYGSFNDPWYWKFDLPRLNEYDDLKEARQLELNVGSHIAPGLTTVYQQGFNINAGDKRALWLHCEDPAGPYHELTLNHRVIFGQDLGKSEGSSQSNKPAPYRVQAFRLYALNPDADFLEQVAKKMHENGHGDQLKINFPPEGQGSFFAQYNTEPAYYSGSVISSFAVKRSIPQNLRNKGYEGMLPLHVTFNIHKDNLRVASHWDELMKQWHDTGDIHTLFSRYFSVYLMSRKDGEKDNPVDLATSLMDSLGGDDVYHDQIKVFVDEDRSVLTVSFIVMLMDGTRDGVRPTLDVVSDRT